MSKKNKKKDAKSTSEPHFAEDRTTSSSPQRVKSKKNFSPTKTKLSNKGSLSSSQKTKKLSSIQKKPNLHTEKKTSQHSIKSPLPPLDLRQSSHSLLSSHKREQKPFLSPYGSSLAIFTISWFILMSDWVSKLLTLIFVKPLQKLPFPFFDLRYVENTGAAFGIFQQATKTLTIISASFIVIVLLCIFVMLLFPNCFIARKLHEYTKTLTGTLSLGLVIGGAGGNLIDRIIRGYVIDMIDVRIWPVFNVADSAITVGIIFMLINVILPRKKELHTQPPQKTSE